MMRRMQKKIFAILFITFTFTLMLLYKFYIIVLLDQTFENCQISNKKLAELENTCREIVDSYFKTQSNETSIYEKKSPKWLSMASNMFAYSAFYEKCPAVLNLDDYCIKFVGMTLHNNRSVMPFTTTIPCAFKVNNDFYRSQTIIELLPEHHEQAFAAAFFYCPVNANVFPSHATFYENSSNWNWLDVQYTKNFNDDAMKSGSSFSLNLCARPFYNELDALQLIEFLSYYSLMGVDSFTFYYTESFKSLHVLTRLQKIFNMNLDLLYWDIPLGNNLIHEYGQIAFTQDCLSRSKYKFKHTIIVDVDEFIMPEIHEDFRDLLHFLDSSHEMAGSYIIPMALFCSEYNNKNNYFYPLRILNHRKRQKTTWLHQYRSKYILRPDRVRYSGVHFTWEFEDGYREVNVSPEIALLQHYRHCCGMAQTWFLHLFEFKVLHDRIVTDNSMLNYLNKLLNNPLLKIVSNITAPISLAFDPS